MEARPIVMGETTPYDENTRLEGVGCGDGGVEGRRLGLMIHESLSHSREVCMYPLQAVQADEEIAQLCHRGGRD